MGSFELASIRQVECHLQAARTSTMKKVSKHFGECSHFDAHVMGRQMGWR